jgi:type I restriction enzyme R subunit
MKTEPSEHNSEWLTRKRRIDPMLDALGWRLSNTGTGSRRIEEEETDSGPADYALWIDDRIVGVVEAKKLSIGPQNVLIQAERYSRGLRETGHNVDGFRAPFLYSTNGEVVWFHDVRHPLNRSRQIAGLHTPDALRELLSRDFERSAGSLLALPNDHAPLRPFQREANAAIEMAVAERKRSMLVAMATGTGKTFTMVNPPAAAHP